LEAAQKEAERFDEHGNRRIETESIRRPQTAEVQPFPTAPSVEGLKPWPEAPAAKPQATGPQTTTPSTNKEEQSKLVQSLIGQDLLIERFGVGSILKSKGVNDNTIVICFNNIEFNY